VKLKGYKNLVVKTIGLKQAGNLLGVYYIAGMGYGGTQYDDLIPAQIDAWDR